MAFNNIGKFWLANGHPRGFTSDLPPTVLAKTGALSGYRHHRYRLTLSQRPVATPNWKLLGTRSDFFTRTVEQTGGISRS